MRRTAVAILIMFIFEPNAFVVADTHYVSHSGTKEYPFTSWATATDSISLAVEASGNWDTIRVGAGTFYEHSVWLKTGSAFVGAGMDSTTLVSTQPGMYVTPLLVMGDSSCVTGFYMSGNGIDRAVLFTDGNTGAMRGNRVRGFNIGMTASIIGFKDPNGLVVVERNVFEQCVDPIRVTDGYSIIRNNRIYPSYAGNQILCGSASVVVEGNVIGGIPPDEGSAAAHRSATVPAEPFYTSIFLDYCYNFVVRNNLMWGGYHAIGVEEFERYEPLLPWGIIENNTCYGLGGGGIAVKRTNVLVRNNIVSNAGRRRSVVVATLPYVRWEYNLLWDYDSLPQWGPGNVPVENVFADPMFVDTIDFRLQTFSPALDAGDPSILDVDGSRSDIGYTGGPGGFSYDYLDLPPGVPTGFTDGGFQDAKLMLTWRRNSESDFARYELFRDMQPIDSADSALLRAVITTDTTYADTLEMPEWDYYYRLRALDAQGNASGLSNEIWHIHAAVDDDDGARPESFALHPNYPNPFNASTRFEIDIPTAGSVHVGVYDILGRRMETLHDGVMPVGRHSFAWTPEHAGSGVYFLVAKFAGMTRVGKMLLLK